MSAVSIIGFSQPCGLDVFDLQQIEDISNLNQLYLSYVKRTQYENRDTLHFRIVGQPIKRIKWKLGNKKGSVKRNRFSLHFCGAKEQTLPCGLEIELESGERVNHAFSIWFFPIAEYEHRALNSPGKSRIVLEQSTLPIRHNDQIAPILQESNLHHIISLEKEFAIEHPFFSINSPANTLRDAIAYLNSTQSRGYSNYAYDTPVNLLKKVQSGEKLTSESYHILTAYMCLSTGVPTRLVKKRSYDEDNFAIEGNASFIEIANSNGRYALAVPWLNLLKVESPTLSYPLSCVDLFSYYTANTMDILKFTVVDSDGTLKDLEKNSNEKITILVDSKKIHLTHKLMIEYLRHMISNGVLMFLNKEQIAITYFWKHHLVEMAKIFDQEKNKCIIWGASGRFREIAEHFSASTIAALVDNNHSIEGSQVSGFTVQSPKVLNDMHSLPILICTADIFRSSIVEQITREYPHFTEIY